MMTDFTRDQAFTIAWFGLMAFMWLGWAQEDPRPSWRGRLALGSATGLSLAIGFGVVVARTWSRASALEGQYHWFGLLTAVEALAAGVGCLVLARRDASVTMAWWVALVVALHFLPLAWLLNDASIALLGLAQAALLIGVRARTPRARHPSSRWVGPLMGFSLLIFSLISAVVFLGR